MNDGGNSTAVQGSNSFVSVESGSLRRTNGKGLEGQRRHRGNPWTSFEPKVGEIVVTAEGQSLRDEIPCVLES